MDFAEGNYFASGDGFDECLEMLKKLPHSDDRLHKTLRANRDLANRFKEMRSDGDEGSVNEKPEFFVLV